MPSTVKALKSAESEDEAKIKFAEYRSIDPFPSISPALLNSADFIDYISATGMVYPFDPSKTEVIKSASLELNIANEVLFWDETGGKKYTAETNRNETIVFRKNSITFVTVDAIFRLPDYIALRFNLQIHHVHRGLLLGTGPLVDPGFEGRLMIPIHNLTENDYELDPFEGLICVEFTKLSNNKIWTDSVDDIFNRTGEYKSNEGKKAKKTFLELIKMHVPQQKVQSSLDSTLVSAQQVIITTEAAVQKSIETARQEIEKLKGQTKIISIASFLVIASILISVWSLVSDANKYVSDAKNIYMGQLNEPENSIVLDINKADYDKIKTLLEEQGKEYESRIRKLETDIYRLNLKISNQNKN